MKKTEHTIGFKSELYDMRVTVHRGATQIKNDRCEAVRFSDSRYFDALFVAMNEFIEEELKDKFYAPEHFVKKCEAARTLFDKDRINFIRAYRSGAVNVVNA